jgi:hypothetical protein
MVTAMTNFTNPDIDVLRFLFSSVISLVLVKGYRMDFVFVIIINREVKGDMFPVIPVALVTDDATLLTTVPKPIGKLVCVRRTTLTLPINWSFWVKFCDAFAIIFSAGLIWITKL